MRKLFTKYLPMTVLTCVLLVAFMGNTAMAGIRDRSSHIELYGDPHKAGHYLNIPEITAPSGSPDTDWGWLYVKNDTGVSKLYFLGSGGSEIDLSAAAATAWDDLANPGSSKTIDFTTYLMVLTGAQTAGDGFTIQNTGGFADISVLKVQQTGGSPSDGTVLEVISNDTDVDALIVTASSTNVISVGGDGKLTLNGGAGIINFTEFDVSGTSGAIVINDDSNAGSITIEGTILDINDLVFVGAGAIVSAASSAITLNPDGGGAEGEDLIITAHNIQLTAEGTMTLSPDSGLTLAIDLSDSDYTNALKLDDNTIEGTTAAINFTDFILSDDGLIVLLPDDGGTGIDITPGAALTIGIDLSDAAITTAIDIGANTIISTGGVFAVTAAGNVTTHDITAGGDVNVTGTISATTFAQNAIIASTDNTTLTVNGSLISGGVSIGTGGGTGPITLGGSGYSTAVNLPAAVDLALAGGTITATDTALVDMVTFTNNSIVTDDLLTLSATGTRTTNNVIAITDGATDATTISITANTQAAGHGFAYGNTGTGLTGAALYLAVTDGGGFTGDYIRCWDGGAEDFTVEKYGETTIAGNATGTAALTLNNGDITVTSGDVDIVLGEITVNSTIASNSVIARNFDNTTGPLLALTITHNDDDDSVLHLDQNATGGELTLEMSSDATGPMIQATTTIAAADGILWVVPASYEGQLFKANLGAWLGTNGEGGIIDMVTTATGTSEVGMGIKLNYQGTASAGTAVQGKGLHVHADAGVKAGESLIYLDTLFNDAIHIKNGGVTAVAMTIESLDAKTSKGIVGDMGAWLGTADQGFIDLRSDGAGTNEAGHAIYIKLQGTGTDAAAISGKGLYMHETAAATANSFLLHVESDDNGAAYLDGDIDINFTNLDDNFNIVSNAADYAAGDGVITVYDDSAGQSNTMYLLRLATEAAADANNGMILCEVNSDGDPGNGDTVFEVKYDGEIVTEGAITAAGSVTVNGAALAGDGATAQSGFVRTIDNSTTTLTIAMSGYVFTNTGAIEFDLPDAATGLTYTFVVGNASNLDVNPQAGDTITWHTCGIGDIIQSATVGDTITLFGISASTWVVLHAAPADGNYTTDTIWVDGGAGG